MRPDGTYLSIHDFKIFHYDMNNKTISDNDGMKFTHVPKDTTVVVQTSLNKQLGQTKITFMIYIEESPITLSYNVGKDIHLDEMIFSVLSSMGLDPTFFKTLPGQKYH